jgi:hypothetical protein
MKRPRSSHFETDRQAALYLEPLLQGNPSLPVEVWVQILLNDNPALSVTDISRLCRVNSAFAELCASDAIWPVIFKRQFGQEAWKTAVAEFESNPNMPAEPGKRAMYLLLIWRIMANVWHTIPHDPYVTRLLHLTNGKYDIFVRAYMVSLTKYRQFTHFNDLKNAFKRHVNIGGPFGWDLNTGVYWEDRQGHFDATLIREIILIGLLEGMHTADRSELVGRCASCDAPAALGCSACQGAVAYCGVDCQAAHWDTHEGECALVGVNHRRPPYTFREQAVAWIQARPATGWRPETKEFGDREMDQDDYLLVQRSSNALGVGLTIQAVGLREPLRRQGHTLVLLTSLEEAARNHGLAYVLVQSVLSDDMTQLVSRAGYLPAPNGSADFIKRL